MYLYNTETIFEYVAATNQIYSKGVGVCKNEKVSEYFDQWMYAAVEFQDIFFKLQITKQVIYKRNIYPQIQIFYVQFIYRKVQVYEYALV